MLAVLTPFASISAQWIDVWVAPTPGSGYDENQQIQITVEFCGQDGAWFDAPGTVEFNGEHAGLGYSWESHPSCSDYQIHTGTVTLEEGTNELYATIAGNAWTAITEYYYAEAEPPPEPDVEVTTDTETIRLSPGPSTQQLFTVMNPRTGSRTYNFTVTCTGVVSCPTTPASITFSAIGTRQVAVPYAVSGAIGATGTLTLRAKEQGDATNTDAATATMQVLPSGPVVDRSLCLTIAAGAAARYECGDLRLAHALPSVRTYNTFRTPVLTYNSQHAHPYPIISAVAALAPGATEPDSVVTTAWVDGQSYRQKAPGSEFLPAESSRRAVVAFDGLHLSTGLHDYTVEVRSFTGGSSAVLTSEIGELPIVNRKDSPFGAGWWLAGYEELMLLPNNRVLWVGGDGSVKLYEQVGAETSGEIFYMASQVTRSDTLIKYGDGVWRRRLPAGGYVKFDATGKHVLSMNRLSKATTFEQNGSGHLWKITVPPFWAELTYEFAYSGSGASAKLSTITVPDSAVGTNRVTSVSIDGTGRLTSIADPGSPAVVFEYDASVARRVSARIDRRAIKTSFRFDAAHRLASATLPLSPTDSSHVAFCSGESMGLTLCQPTLAAPADVRTVFDGARNPQDVSDVTTFWLDRFGSPSRIRDALDNETILDRGDARFPALATRLETPDGHVMSAAYDSRGNVIVATDSSNFQWQGGSQVFARTLYQWDSKWNVPTKITSPGGAYRQMSYDASNGNLLWEEDKRGSSSRTSYEYYGDGLMRAAIEPGGARDSLAYDATRLNVSSTISALDRRTHFVTDRLGRVTVTRRVLNNATNKSQNDSIYYDQLDRVVRQVSYGPILNGQDPQRLTVTLTRDDEGNLLSTTRAMSPVVGGIGPLTLSRVYDAAGRPVAAFSSDGKRDSTVYDEAGNPIKLITRRGDSIKTKYDELNRLVERELSPVVYAPYRAGASDQNTGASHNPPYGGLTIPGDTTTYEYDAMGRIVRAANRDARIARTYRTFGALDTDSLFIRTLKRDAEHAYGMRYDYDYLNGWTNLWYPSQLVTGTQARVRYEHDPTTGFLRDVHGLQNERFTFTYNDRSELTQVAMPGGILEHSVYDDDGMLVTHKIQNATSPSLADRYPHAWIEETALTYDARGKVLTADNIYGINDSRSVQYTGLGHLKEQTYAADGHTIRGDLLNATVDEQYQYDAMGNIHEATETFAGLFGTGEFWSSTTPRAATFEATTGRILTQLLTIDQGDNSQMFIYDDQGNTELASMVRDSWNPENQQVVIDDRVSYYDAAGVLRRSERRYHLKPGSDPWEDAFLQRIEEWYRYDPLGRRILVRSVGSCFNYGSTKPNCDIGYVRRTVWNGNQELVEIQRPDSSMPLPWYPFPESRVELMENDTSAIDLPVRSVWNGYNTWFDPNRLFGRVAYTHGPGIDRPLSITRLGYVNAVPIESHPYGLNYSWPTFSMVPHWNARGEASTGTFANGAARYRINVDGYDREVAVEWPRGELAYGRLKADTIESWHGTLVHQKQDRVGTLYRRNRNYDPSTGRFTQEDPIGLAGGLNLYGFAGGDPVNFSDPFGLCPIPPTNCADFAFLGLSVVDLFLDPSWGNLGWAALDAAALIPGIPSSGVFRRGAQAAEAAAGRYKAFTKRNFRHNLGVRTGGKVAGAHAHHVLPQEFRKDFKKLGIEIDDPQFGAWWEAGSHLSNHAMYNAEWAAFFREERTREEVLQFGREIAWKYNLDIKF